MSFVCLNKQGYNNYMNKTTAKKYLSAINGSKRKHLTCEGLSLHMGIYPEIIASELSEFEPMLAMDPSYNLRDLVPALEAYIEEQSKEKKEPRIAVKKAEVSQYKSVADFVYNKMTIGGLVDRNIPLSEKDLKLLRHLVNQELDALKGAKPNKKKRK